MSTTSLSVTPETPAAPPTPDLSHVQGDGQRVTVNTEQAAAQQDTPKAPDRPSWLPEKFKSAEDMAKSYAELEKKVSSGKPADVAPVATPETPAPDAAKAVSEAGLDMSKLSQEVAENGTLSDESRAALKAKGITDAQIDTHIEGQKALAQAEVSRIAAAVGGMESVTAIMEWAGTALTPDEAEATNEILANGTEKAKTAILKGLASRYEQANGVEPRLLRAAATPSVSGPKPFGDRMEMVKAMSHPDYQTSPAYRAEVERRVAASDLGFGVGRR